MEAKVRMSVGYPTSSADEKEKTLELPEDLLNSVDDTTKPIASSPLMEGSTKLVTSSVDNLITSAKYATYSDDEKEKLRTSSDEIDDSLMRINSASSRNPFPKPEPKPVDDPTYSDDEKEKLLTSSDEIDDSLMRINSASSRNPFPKPEPKPVDDPTYSDDEKEKLPTSSDEIDDSLMRINSASSRNPFPKPETKPVDDPNKTSSNLLSRKPVRNPTNFDNIDFLITSFDPTPPEVFQSSYFIQKSNQASMELLPVQPLSFEERFIKGAPMPGSYLLSSDNQRELISRWIQIDKETDSCLFTNDVNSVQDWISRYIVKNGITKIGISTESDDHETADIITLHVKGYSLIYQVAGAPMSKDFLQLIRRVDCRFGGQESAEKMIERTVWSQTEGLILRCDKVLPNIHRVGPECKNENPYTFSEPLLSWRDHDLTQAQIRRSYREAKSGWERIPEIATGSMDGQQEESV